MHCSFGFKKSADLRNRIAIPDKNNPFISINISSKSYGDEFLFTSIECEYVVVVWKSSYQSIEHTIHQVADKNSLQY